MNDQIEDIMGKYISKKENVNISGREPLKQNLQADINKIDGIISKLIEKEAPPSELNRLRDSVVKLLSVIDNNEKII
jgi:hypothetical protein